MTIQERLRETCTKLRRTPMPISDVIPLLQEAAEKIDVLELERRGVRISCHPAGVGFSDVTGEVF